MVFNNNFVLASSSLSRFRILKNINLRFKKIKPKCNEKKLKKKLIEKKVSAKILSLELARLKSQSISVEKRKQIIVGSDTIVSFKGVFLTKAKTLGEAKKIIKLVSGNTLFVYSSASLFYNNKEIWHATQKTKIKIRKLTNNEISYYLKKAGKTILTSVGCFQLESMGPNIVEEVDGDFFNVMGFPLFPFLNFLKRYKPNNK